MCDGNYANTNTKDREPVTIFTFPSNKDEERKWIESLPNLLTASSTSYLGICVRHWPEGYPTVTSKNGKKRPALPPSVFGVPQSYLQQCKHNKPYRKVKKTKS